MHIRFILSKEEEKKKWLFLKHTAEKRALHFDLPMHEERPRAAFPIPSQAAA